MNNRFNLLLLEFLEGKADSISFKTVEGLVIRIFQKIYPNKKRNTTIYLDNKATYNFIADGTFKQNKDKKGTGGKRSYLKLYMDNLDDIEDLSLESAGLLFKLGNKIQWHSQRLKYSRRKSYLTYDDLKDICKKRESKLNEMLKELRENKLLWHDGKSYVISPNLIRKGGVAHEN